MIAVNTDSPKERITILCRSGYRWIGKNKPKGRQVLQVGGVKMTVLKAPANDRIVPRLLPDLLQFSGINLQLINKIFMHRDALHAGQRCDAGHRNRVNIGPESDQSRLSLIGKRKSIIEASDKKDRVNPWTPFMMIAKAENRLLRFSRAHI